MAEEKNYFQTLNDIDVSSKTEKKNGLTYLSWSWAWGEIKKIHPDTTFKVYERENGLIYWDDGKTAWVKVGVTCNGIEHIEYLPIMNGANKPIPLESINSFDVNKAIQRARTKAIADHGIGLYVYAGEDLPESVTIAKAEEEAAKAKEAHTCSVCGKEITSHGNYTAEQIIDVTNRRYGKPMCFECSAKQKQQGE